MAILLGISEREYRESAASLWKPPEDPTLPLQNLNARRTLMDIVGVTVRVVKPRVMVETGVAAGFTTAVALAAMEANGIGHLYSLDLPPLEVSRRATSGASYPTT